MAKRTDLKIPYGILDFKRIRNEGLYYVDKTMFLAQLEESDSFVFFVRPRRFGKSLFVDMLRLYYDRNEKKNFRPLFHYCGILSHEAWQDRDDAGDLEASKYRRYVR